MTESVTVAYKIFHYYFKCYMPQHQLRNEDYLKYVGIPTTEDRVVDRELANAPMLCQLTVSEMATHFANGATLQLQTPKDCVTIYQMIKEHLDNWQTIVNDPLDYTEPPIDDLEKFDALAIELYKTARGYLNEDQLGNRLFKGLAALESRHKFRRHAPKTDGDESFKVPQEHVSVSETIGRAAFKKNRHWFKRDKTDAS